MSGTIVERRVARYRKRGVRPAQLGDQEIEQGTVTVDQDFERALIADLRC